MVNFFEFTKGSGRGVDPKPNFKKNFISLSWCIFKNELGGRVGNEVDLTRHMDGLFHKGLTHLIKGGILSLPALSVNS